MAVAITASKPVNGIASTSIHDGDEPHNEMQEQCPVCKTLRYLNRDLRFLISPECYHPMCTTCVDRLFLAGPKQCPYAGCHKTLRKREFKEAYFGDLHIEREVDIRRRVAAIFNKRESDFEDLKSYNNYLEMVECLIFDLVSGDDAARLSAEARLLDWEKQHQEEIEAIRRARGDEKEMRRLQMAREREEERRRREIMAEEDEEERRRKHSARAEMLDVAVNADSAEVAQKDIRIILKKRGQDREARAKAAAAATDFSQRAARDAAVTEAEMLKSQKLTPFQGLRFSPARFRMNPEPDAYDEADLDKFTDLLEYQAGGYSAQEYWKRSMYEASSGLFIFIETHPGAGADSSSAKLCSQPVV